MMVSALCDAAGEPSSTNLNKNEVMYLLTTIFSGDFGAHSPRNLCMKSRTCSWRPYSESYAKFNTKSCSASVATAATISDVSCFHISSITNDFVLDVSIRDYLRCELLNVEGFESDADDVLLVEYIPDHGQKNAADFALIRGRIDRCGRPREHRWSDRAPQFWGAAAARLCR